MSTSDSHVPAPLSTAKRPRNPEEWIRRPLTRSRARSLAYRPGVEFFDLADPIVAEKRTLLGYDRLYVFWQSIRNVVDVPGHVVEVGTYRGGSALFIAQAVIAITGGEVPMHVFDTFEGHPAGALTEHDEFHTAGQFDRTSYEDVKALLAPFTQLEVHKGDVATQLPGLADAVYRLVHIDTDLHQPTLLCLEYFGRRMSTGGVVIIDDYGSKKCPGVPKAVVEYLKDTDAFQAWDMRTEQLMLVKR